MDHFHAGFDGVVIFDGLEPVENVKCVHESGPGEEEAGGEAGGDGALANDEEGG